MLKKIIIVLLVLLSGLVAAKVLNLPIPFLNAQTKNSDTAILKYVPQESAFYLSSDIALMHASMQMSNIETIIDNAKSEFGYMSPQEEQISDSVIGFVKAFITEAGAIEYGISTQGEIAMYLDGLFPVFKISVADQTKLNKKITELFAQIDEIVVTDKNLNGQMIKQINIEDEAIVSYQVTDEYFTLTFGPAQLEQSTLESIFDPMGKVESVLASDAHKSDQTKYGFNDSFKMIVNIKEIASAIVEPSASLLGQQLQQYVPESQSRLAMVQSAECKEDVMSIANAMPRLVAGYTELDITPTSLNAKSDVILEIMNPQVLDILKMVVGHISSNALSQDSILSMGVGVDVAQLMPAYDQLSQLIQATEYKCMPLAMGKMFMPPAPAQLAMVAQAAGSVKGLSASIIDMEVDFSQGMPQLTSFDALVALSTNDAASLAMMASANPYVTFDALDPNGTASVLNIPIPLGVEIKAAIKNNFLTVYSGAEGEKAANALSTESLEANALVSFAINFGKILAKEELFKNALMMAGPGVCEDASVQEAIKMVSSNHGAESAQMLVNDFGVVFSGQSNMIKSDSEFNVCPYIIKAQY